MRSPLPPSPWLVCPRQDPNAPLRLWCLPFAGGGAAAWHPWADPLAGVAEIVALRPPGRENRVTEPPFTRMPDIIPRLVDQIAPFTGEEYALCGHSLGGLMAFELVHALRARGLGQPRALIVCGVRAPHCPPDEPWLHPLPHGPFMAEVEQRYGPIPAEIRDCPELLELLLPVLRADLEVYETYRYQAASPLQVPVLALGGEHDAMVPLDSLRAWRQYTTGHFECRLVPGGHFFPQEQRAATVPHVRTFLERCIPAAASRVTMPSGRGGNIPGQPAPPTFRPR